MKLSITQVYKNKTDSQLNYCQILSNIEEYIEDDKNLKSLDAEPDELSGIWDGNKQTDQYVALLGKHSILHASETEIIDHIKSTIEMLGAASHKSFAVDPTVLDFQSLKPWTRQITNNEKAEIVLKVNVKHLEPRIVAEENKLTEIEVQDIINEYQRKLRAASKKRSKLRDQCKLKDTHKEWISSKLKQMLGEYFTLQTFKEILLKRFPDLNNISTSTLSRYFRNKLRMSYKKCSRLERRMKTPELKIEFMKWAALISSLAVLDKNTLFVDEFKISSKSNGRYWWSLRGAPGTLWSSNTSFEFSAIAAFNANGRIYLLGTNEKVNAAVFEYFIRKITNYEQLVDQDLKSRIIVADNAAYHKTQAVREMLISKNLTLVTITAYSPSLNPTEKLIRYIKQKISKMKAANR